MPFAINETTGELFTTAVLDRETIAIYRLTVIASDKHPTQPLLNSVLVTVHVGDINDHWPHFMNSPYVAYVPSAMAPGESFDFHLIVLDFTHERVQSFVLFEFCVFCLQAQLFVQSEHQMEILR